MPDSTLLSQGDTRRASWLASLVITAIGAFSVSFFYLSLASSSVGSVAGAIAMSLYCAILLLILRSGKPGKWRRVFFGCIALFFFPEFIANLIEMRGHMTVEPLNILTCQVPYCHIVSTMTLIPMALTKTVIFPGMVTGFYASIYSMLTIWLCVSLILGRGWCSWVCFYGGWDDMFSRSRKKALVSLAGKEGEIRAFNQAMLVFVVLASMATLTAVYCVWFCPFKILSEYEAIKSIGSYVATIVFIALFVGLVIVLPALTRKRFQCSAFCPMGALNAIMDRVSPFGIRIDADKCSRCKLCVKACPLCALDDGIIENGKGKPYHSCAKCGECVEVCPNKAIRFVFRPTEWVRRRFRLDRPISAPKTKVVGHSLIGRIAIRITGFARELLDARLVFTLTAFILGATLSYTFAVGTIARIINLITTGIFTRGY